MEITRCWCMVVDGLDVIRWSYDETVMIICCCMVVDGIDVMRWSYDDNDICRC